MRLALKQQAPQPAAGRRGLFDASPYKSLLFYSPASRKVSISNVFEYWLYNGNAVTHTNEHNITIPGAGNEYIATFHRQNSDSEEE